MDSIESIARKLTTAIVSDCILIHRAHPVCQPIGHAKQCALHTASQGAGATVADGLLE